MRLCVVSQCPTCVFFDTDCCDVYPQIHRLNCHSTYLIERESPLCTDTGSVLRSRFQSLIQFLLHGSFPKITRICNRLAKEPPAPPIRLRTEPLMHRNGSGSNISRNQSWAQMPEHEVTSLH